MTAPIMPHRLTRRAVLRGGALTVGFVFAGVRTQAQAQDATAAPRSLDPKNVDSFLSVNSDGTVTVFCGKVDLGQGLRIAIRQIAGEELWIGVEMIQYVEGDTALTPDQGRTSGSNGIQRGGMQIRQAAATAREVLIEVAAQRLNMKADELVAKVTIGRRHLRHAPFVSLLVPVASAGLTVALSGCCSGVAWGRNRSMFPSSITVLCIFSRFLA